MKLDRSVNSDGKCKYALVKLRNLKSLSNNTELQRATTALKTLEALNMLDYAASGDSECFVIRLKDKYAFPSLVAYAAAAVEEDVEYALEILKLASKSLAHPGKKRPD